MKEVDGKSNEVLDGEILGVIRFWMKSRWVEHSSMSVDGNAYCHCSKDDKFKGLQDLPSLGLTVKVNPALVSHIPFFESFV